MNTSGEQAVADPPVPDATPTARATAEPRTRALNVPSWLVVAAAVALVTLGQIAEDLADSPALQMAPPILAQERWTLIVLVWYMVVIATIVDRTVKRSVPALDRVIKVNAKTFRSIVDQMRPPDMRVNLVLLAASALIVTVLFVGVGVSLPIDDQGAGRAMYLPMDRLAALFMLAG